MEESGAPEFKKSVIGGLLRSRMARGAAWMSILTLAARVMQVITAALLARMLGADGYGMYAYAATLVGLMSVPAHLGFPHLVLREVAVNGVNRRWGDTAGLLRRSRQIALASSSVLVAVGAAFGWLAADDINALHFPTYAWSLLLVPIVSSITIQGAALKGFHHVLQGELPTVLVRPVVFLILIAISSLAFQALGPSQAAMLSVLAGLAAYCISLWLLRKCTPAQVKSAEPVYRGKEWLRGAFPFALLGCTQLLTTQTDTVMLGVLGSAADVGIYRVVTQGALLTSISLVVVSKMIRPQVASLYAAHDLKGLQRLITKSMRAAMYMSVPPCLCLVFFGGAILGLVFGPEYEAGSFALAVLTVGSLIYVISGASSLILDMTGHERYSLIGLALGATMNVALNFLLIPPLGLNGAALATTISLAASNIYLAVMVFRKTHLLSLPFAFGWSPR